MKKQYILIAILLFTLVGCQQQAETVETIETMGNSFQRESEFVQLKFREHMRNIDEFEYEIIDIRFSKHPDNDLNTVAVIGYYIEDNNSEQTYGYYLKQIGDAFDIKAEGKGVNASLLKKK